MIHLLIYIIIFIKSVDVKRLFSAYRNLLEIIKHLNRKIFLKIHSLINLNKLNTLYL